MGTPERAAGMALAVLNPTIAPLITILWIRGMLMNRRRTLRQMQVMRHGRARFKGIEDFFREMTDGAPERLGQGAEAWEQVRVLAGRLGAAGF